MTEPHEPTPEELIDDPEVAVVMVTGRMWDDVQAGWRATIRSLTRLVVAVVAVLIFAAVFFGWAYHQSQNREDESRRRQERSQAFEACVTRHQAVALGDVVEALKGAPTDPTRNAKLTIAADELAQLVNVDNVC